MQESTEFPSGTKFMDETFLSSRREELTIQFMKEVEKYHSTGNSYLESVLAYCEEYDVEYDQVAKIIPPVLYNKLREEAEESNLIRKTATLDCF